MDITLLASGLGQVMSLGKALIEIRDQTLFNAKAIEFQQAIMTVQQQAMSLQLEQQNLLNRIHELEEECRKGKDIPGVVYEKPYYWKLVEDTKDGPYCQPCYDSDRKLIRLQEGRPGKWFCHSCRGTYYDSRYVSPALHRGQTGSIRGHDPYSW